ncbi:MULTISPECIES: hypothetical protein [unclassified Arthrobacter]|uniref:hypothetical protein n=1 Tax=unclassified Arthrobacter TaxID=235627 RepID=UPI001E3F9895|nr:MULTISPECIES: hypothetical protein [unclassified Arthrobacter]MCC9146763.1 hypothetical protein [Arthrobacter sp. zg-Y919]MDK1277994.1 hypothetical protein [Arthrobacter sp. zg.Y919]MDM7991594.1 hypothetical protein [Arthrobacter sp. zg-Y877]WIB03415.1 hypothetical protein QNO10_01605 [Arthrobacter sp. zg-Y919]
MSNQEPVSNPGAKAVDENLAGTADEFNDAVTRAMVEDAQQADSKPGDEERDSQEALEVDEETQAKPDNS